MCFSTSKCIKMSLSKASFRSLGFFTQHKGHGARLWSSERILHGHRLHFQADWYSQLELLQSLGMFEIHKRKLNFKGENTNFTRKTMHYFQATEKLQNFNYHCIISLFLRENKSKFHCEVSLQTSFFPNFPVLHVYAQLMFAKGLQCQEPTQFDAFLAHLGQKVKIWWRYIKLFGEKNDETYTNEKHMKEHLELGLLDFGSDIHSFQNLGFAQLSEFSPVILFFWDPCRYSFSLATWMTQTCKLCETSSEGLLCHEILVSSNTKTIPSKGQRDVSFVQIYQWMARVPKRIDAMQGGWLDCKEESTEQETQSYLLHTSKGYQQWDSQPNHPSEISTCSRCQKVSGATLLVSSSSATVFVFRSLSSCRLPSLPAEQTLKKEKELSQLSQLKQLSCRKTLFIRLLFGHVFLLSLFLSLFFPVFLVFMTDRPYSLSLHRHCFPS